MSDPKDIISKAIDESLSVKGYDIVNLVKIPRNVDPNFSQKAIKEILGDSTELDGPEFQSYLVKVKARKDGAKPAAKPGSEMYADNGKVNVPFLLKNAEVLIKFSDYTLAKNIYSTVLQTREYSGEAHYGMGKCEEALGNLEDSRKHYEEAIAYIPSLEIYESLARVLKKLGRSEYQGEVLERALLIKGIEDKKRFSLLVDAGSAWVKAGSHERAKGHFLKALELEPRSDAVHSNLGSVLLQQGKIVEAIRAFEDAIEINGRNHSAHLGLGCSYLAEGDKRTAYDYFAKSLEIELRNSTAIFYLIKCAYEIKSFEKAEFIVENYVQVAPVNASLLFGLAGLQYHLSKFDKCENTAKKVLELKPDHKGAAELLKLVERAKKL